MNEKKSRGYLGKALLIELRPLPMVLAILAALFGATLAHEVYGLKYAPMLIHVANVIVILYSSHLVDTYNDMKNREEYQRGYKRRFLFDSHDPQKVVKLNPKHYIYAMLCTYPVAFILSGILVVETGLAYAILAFVGIVLSFAYGFGLDRIAIAGDFAWEMGVVLSFAGGFYVTSLTLTPQIVVMVLTLLPILLGVKILDAEPDYGVDRASVPRKNTIPVLLGVQKSHRLAYGLIIAPLVLLMFMVPALNLTLEVPLIVALVSIMYSYKYPAIKGIYFIAGAIIFFLVWAITVV